MYNNRDKFKERVVMASGIYAEIKKRILDAEYGAVFVTSDFNGTIVGEALLLES